MVDLSELAEISLVQRAFEGRLACANFTAFQEGVASMLDDEDSSVALALALVVAF